MVANDVRIERVELCEIVYEYNNLILESEFYLVNIDESGLNVCWKAYWLKDSDIKRQVQKVLEDLKQRTDKINEVNNG